MGVAPPAAAADRIAALRRRIDAWRRPLANVFLVGFLLVIAIDAFRPVNEAHQALKDELNLPLVLTGLWQGPWRLYAPDVEKHNLRLKADVVFADGATATWSSPDWPALSAAHKFARAREMNYFHAILLADHQLEWTDLCAYLARTVRHPDGKPVAVREVTLSLRVAEVPPPGERAVPAGPYVAFDDWQRIHVWSPGA